jgi:hypothetical protein
VKLSAESALADAPFPGFERTIRQIGVSSASDQRASMDAVRCLHSVLDSKEAREARELGSDAACVALLAVAEAEGEHALFGGLGRGTGQRQRLSGACRSSTPAWIYVRWGLACRRVV